MVDAGTSTSTGGRRGLGPGLTAFVVVDVLLVMAVLVVLAVFVTDRGGADAGAQPVPTVTDTAGSDSDSEQDPEPTAPAAPAGPGAFALPSGNIACEMTEDAATCTVAESNAAPVPVDGCAGAAGQVVTVTAEGVSTPCVQGALPGHAAPGTPVLEYGRSMVSGDFECASAETGVTCRYLPTGAGFSLARAGHQVLG